MSASRLLSKPGPEQVAPRRRCLLDQADLRLEVGKFLGAFRSRREVDVLVANDALDEIGREFRALRLDIERGGVLRIGLDPFVGAVEAADERQNRLWIVVD